MSMLTEKRKTRNRKHLAVTQWLRNMPDSTGQQSLKMENQPEKMSNITINVQQASEDEDDDHGQSNEVHCNESSINACSTRPFLLYGNKCSLNDPEPNFRPNATGTTRRVKFDVKSKYEKTDDKPEESEKRVKFYDVIIRTAEEDHDVLKRNMKQFLIESSKTTRKERKSATERSTNSKPSNAKPDDTEHPVETGKRLHFFLLNNINDFLMKKTS